MDNLVLIVDDDEKLSKMLGFLFMAKGFKVEYARNGSSALDLLERIKPNVIILDIMMPGMDGFEVCERIKEDSSLNEIPVIVLSALPSIQSKKKILALGAYDYFEKPFKSSDLIEKALEAVGAK